MILAMILAHLVGDFVLQSDRLAYWKSIDVGGVVVHGIIILGVTALFALPFKPYLWTVVLFITVTHVLIDFVQLFYRPNIAPILRFTIDQLLHFLVIFIALATNGHLNNSAPQIYHGVELETILILALGYTFVTMPTWVILKFAGYAIVEGSAPVFPDTFNKYAGIIERVSILTATLAGLYLLVPVVVIARLIVERQHLLDSARWPLYIFESMAGVGTAILVGLLMKAMVRVGI